MIAITGIRSGTSMTMQTLKLLGVSITGVKYPKVYPQEFNKKGYWDLEFGEYLDGVPDKRFCGTAIKLVLGQLLKSKHISKLIICQRNKDDCVKSIRKLQQGIQDATGLPTTAYSAEYVYNSVFSCAESCAEHLNTFRLNFEEMLIEPYLQIQKLADFLNLKNPNISNAVKNIN